MLKKLTWSNARLAEEYDAAFEQFLDEMRELDFSEEPSYGYWKLVFASIFRSTRSVFAV